jgi:hypothetical protein
MVIFASYLAMKKIKMFWGHIHKHLEEDKNGVGGVIFTNSNFGLIVKFNIIRKIVLAIIKI